MMSSLLTIWVKQLWSPASTVIKTKGSQTSCPFPAVICMFLADRKFKKFFFPYFFSFLSSPALLPPKKKETKGVSERSDLKTNGYFFYERVRCTGYDTKRYIFRSFPHSWVKLAHYVPCIFCFLKALLVKSKESSNKICIKTIFLCRGSWNKHGANFPSVLQTSRPMMSCWH